jgi:glycosyltransferase involved in cell wall biosynthesis
MYEELSFASSLARRVPIDAFDVTLTCGFPYLNLLLQRSKMFPRRGKHIFVTQNGDWAASGSGLEPRFFTCDGLICTNPIYYDRNKDRWTAALIPNGIEPARFCPGPAERERLGFPLNKSVVLMVSALEPGKRVIEAMRSVAQVPDAYLVVAGDGPLRGEVDALAARLLPGRFHRSLFAHEDMPSLYRSCDVFLHTCIRESFGNVYIEALSSGARIVAHDDEVTRWILGAHARLVDTTDAGRLAAAISAALATPGDVSAEAVRYAHKRFGWAAVAQSYAGFCEAILAREPT